MNYLFKSVLYYLLEGLFVDFMLYIIWIFVYSFNIMNIENFENCYLK